MNFKLNIVLICFFIISTASAQKIDADAIIEKTWHIYEAWEGTEAKFTTHISSLRNDASESFEGVLQTKKDKFFLTVPEMMVWFDGATQWTYLPHSKEVNISAPSGDDLLLLNPMLFLQEYKKDYNATLTGESVFANAKAVYDITLTPRKTGTIDKIEIQIEKNASLPVKIIITMRNQLRNTIIINELKKGSHADELFSFPEASYLGVEVIDLR